MVMILCLFITVVQIHIKQDKKTLTQMLVVVLRDLKGVIHAATDNVDIFAYGYEGLSSKTVYN